LHQLGPIHRSRGAIDACNAADERLEGLDDRVASCRVAALGRRHELALLLGRERRARIATRNAGGNCHVVS
jgi:hypothetical protein